MRAPDHLKVRADGPVRFVQIDRPGAENAINAALVAELGQVLDECEREAGVVVLEGLPDVFCTGADFAELTAHPGPPSHSEARESAAALYDLWRRLAAGPYVSIAHVRGRVSAGGLGFVAACDVVLSDERATFALPELLFGLMPACVMPFLVRRIGYARANVMALTTQPVPARQALEWGLVDACEADSANLLRKQLLRLRRLGKPALARYKAYVQTLEQPVSASRERAVTANADVFCDAANVRGIARFVQTGAFPWEPA